MSEIFLCSSKPPYTNEKYLDQPKQRSAQGSSNRTIHGQQIPSHKWEEEKSREVEKKEKRKAVEKKIMTFEVANYPAQRFLRKIGQSQMGQ